MEDSDGRTTPRRVKWGAVSSEEEEEEAEMDMATTAATTTRRVKRAVAATGMAGEDDEDDESSSSEGEEDDEGRGSTRDGPPADDDDAGTDDTVNEYGEGHGHDGIGGKLQAARYLSEQRVYALDKGEVYEAVILKARLRTVSDADGNPSHQWSYFVHYLGWSSRWDKWVDESDLREDTEETRAWAERVKEKTREAERTRKARAKERRERKERAKEARREAKVRRRREQEGPTLEDCCALPFTLKTVMVDDRDRIARLGRCASGYDDVASIPDWRPCRLLHILPAPVTIRAVLGQFLKSRRRDLVRSVEEGRMEKEAAEARASDCTGFVDDLCRLFDRALPIWLLYRQEQTQHLAIERDPELRRTRKCELYGCEHLLRLFVRLPGVARGASDLLSDVSKAGDFGRDVADLVVFLQRNRTACFKARYREPREEELTEAERSVIRRCSSSLETC